LGNDILKNLGVEEPIDDVAVFFRYDYIFKLFNVIVMSFIFNFSKLPFLILISVS